MKILKYLN
jgi:hypothetical protein